MKIKSYAKLNLTLEILGRNSSNMHEISGIFQNINLFDEIEILESNFDSVNTFNFDIIQEDNLAFKALKLMKKELSINNISEKLQSNPDHTRRVCMNYSAKTN